MAMGSPGETFDRIEALRALLERLSAPDLTLAEAKALRPHLTDLLNPRIQDAVPGRLADSGEVASRLE
ncbi:hypothetical protein [Tautonia sociabilis]|uniref:Uncharacterized protein n=1 Tax=Tautonia sociabilis TaxID=2080755 RepID=A0A432MJI4_9BACT|nr:hypothetical protein [Tautonia sociabilis]RUL87367.1 hypothetical protein TsocGM_12620 [Tautonia sociabilis]